MGKNRTGFECKSHKFVVHSNHHNPVRRGSRTLFAAAGKSMETLNTALNEQFQLTKQRINTSIRISAIWDFLLVAGNVGSMPKTETQLVILSSFMKEHITEESVADLYGIWELAVKRAGSKAMGPTAKELMVASDEYSKGI